jgi:hypothetical protein
MLARGRRLAEARMSETCQIGREIDGPLDEATGKRTKVIEPVYSGPCRFRAANVQARDVEVLGQFLVSQSATLSLPIDGSGLVTKGHIVRITASKTDPALVDKQATIDGPFASSDATARRFPVTVRT